MPFCTFELRMNEIELFYLLKEKVLEKYKEDFPFFDGNWKSFSTEDIRNLMDLIEQKTGQTLSEKWIYTHLKPAQNEKLPRKDTLNILSEFAGVSSWDEFRFSVENERPEVKKVKQRKSVVLLTSGIFLTGILLFWLINKKPEKQTIELKNEFTQEKIQDENLKVYELKENEKIPVKVEDSKIKIENKDSKIVVESPYYKTGEIEIKKDEPKSEIAIKPDDYAMMLKAFMLSDIKDWETRKGQLEKVLSDDLEVIVMLRNNLGAEYFNKKEFTQMLVIPSENLKKMKIVELENDENKQIKFIRIKQN